MHSSKGGGAIFRLKMPCWNAHRVEALRFYQTWTISSAAGASLAAFQPVLWKLRYLGTWNRDDPGPQKSKRLTLKPSFTMLKLGPCAKTLASLDLRVNDGGSPLLLLSRQLVPRGLPRGQLVLDSLGPDGRDGGKCASSARQEPVSQRLGTIQICLEHSLRHIIARCGPVVLSLLCSLSVHKPRTYLPSSVAVAPDAGLDGILIGFEDRQDNI